jgi:O-antigen/teichoic acid export membrane protein
MVFSDICLQMLKKEIITTIGARIVIMLSGFTASILTARFLGPEGRGEYFFIVTLVALSVQFGNLGLHASNTYLVAKDHSLLSKLTANSLWISLLIGGGVPLVAVLFLSFVNIFPEISSTKIWFAVLLAPLSLFFMLGSNLLVGINQIKVFNFFQVGNNMITLLLIGIAAYLGFSVAGFLGAGVISGLLSSSYLLVRLKDYFAGSLTFDFQTFRTGFRYSMKAYFTAFLGIMVMRSNVFILQRYSGTETLGYFSIASQIFDVLSILPASVALVLFPNLVRTKDGRWETTRRYLFSVGLMVMAACLIAAFLVKPFVKIAFGNAFLPSAPIVLWMLPGVFFLSLTTILSQHLAAMGFPKSLVIIWGISFIVVILSSVILIPLFSGIGATMALSITYALLFFMVLGLTLKIGINR